MRAAVLEQMDGKLRIIGDWPEPTAGPGEVIVQVRGVGICGSDLALLGGRRRPPKLPWIPGHETIGDIVATGSGVAPERIGERVAVEPNLPCLACPACLAGMTSACQRRIILGFNAPGTLAERIAVPATSHGRSPLTGPTPTRYARSPSPSRRQPSGELAMLRARDGWLSEPGLRGHCCASHSRTRA